MIMVPARVLALLFPFQYPLYLNCEAVSGNDDSAIFVLQQGFGLKQRFCITFTGYKYFWQ